MSLSFDYESFQQMIEPTPELDTKVIDALYQNALQKIDEELMEVDCERWDVVEVIFNHETDEIALPKVRKRMDYSMSAEDLYDDSTIYSATTDELADTRDTFKTPSSLHGDKHG